MAPRSKPAEAAPAAPLSDNAVTATMAAAAAASALKDEEGAAPAESSSEAPAAPVSSEPAAPAPGKRTRKPRGNRQGESLHNRLQKAMAQRDELAQRLGVKIGRSGFIETEGKSQEPPPDPKEAQKAVTGVLRFVFGAIALQRGDHWKMSDEEAQEIAEPLGKALAPHLPALGDNLYWILGGMKLAGSVQERADTDNKLKAGKAVVSNGAPPAPTGPSDRRVTAEVAE